jgi:hypothetical protein
MGYRSDGQLVISKKVLFIATLNNTSQPALLGEMDKNEFGKDHLSFTYVDWKMYESYPDVKEFYAWLDKLDDIGEGYEYAYVELGEELEDITHRGSHELIYVSRSIEAY